MSNAVLKGGISYFEGFVEYVWHTSDGACEKCQALNGKVFSSIDEIPDLPHPNCKCWVEDREKKENYIYEENKEDLLDDLDKIISDFSSLKQEIQHAIENIINIRYQYQDSSNVLNEYLHDLQELLKNCENNIYNVQINHQDLSQNKLQDIINILLEKYSNLEHQFNLIYTALQEEINNIKNKTGIDENFKNDFKKHEEMKQLLNHHHNNTPLPEGYDLEAKYTNSKTGLDLEVYKRGNEIIFSFPGSEQPIKDFFKTDIENIKFNNKNPQLDEAQKIFDKVKQNPKYKNYKFSATGYSLGGNIAGGISALNGIEGVTFNSFGNLNDILQQKANDENKIIKVDPSKLVNYRHEDDFLSKNSHSYNPGMQFNLPKPIENKSKIDPISHTLQNIENPISRYPDGNSLHKTRYYPRSKL